MTYPWKKSKENKEKIKRKTIAGQTLKDLWCYMRHSNGREICINIPCIIYFVCGFWIICGISLRFCLHGLVLYNCMKVWSLQPQISRSKLELRGEHMRAEHYEQDV